MKQKFRAVVRVNRIEDGVAYVEVPSSRVDGEFAMPDSNFPEDVDLPYRCFARVDLEARYPSELGFEGWEHPALDGDDEE